MTPRIKEMVDAAVKSFAETFVIDPCERCDGLGKTGSLASTDPWKKCDICDGHGNELERLGQI